MVRGDEELETLTRAPNATFYVTTKLCHLPRLCPRRRPARASSSCSLPRHRHPPPPFSALSAPNSPDWPARRRVQRCDRNVMDTGDPTYVRVPLSLYQLVYVS